MQKKADDSITLCNAFDEVEKKVKATQARGSRTQSIVREDTQHKYICVGNQTNRGGVGIRRYHRALLECPRHIQSRVMRYFKTVEHLFTMFMDTEEIRIIHDAIELMQSETFTIPQNFASSNVKLHTKEDHIEKAAIYGAFACGVNVYLASHTDADYTYSATSVHRRGQYLGDDTILCYFAFPRLGFAIPLRTGDVLFFNPKEPHCLSSRVNNADENYCVSLYLKSDNIGKHDNGIPLTSYEDTLLQYYNCNK